MMVQSAIKCMCATLTCALIYLCLTFGSSFNPAKWCVLIEIITNITNDITNNPHWLLSTTFAPTF